MFRELYGIRMDNMLTPAQQPGDARQDAVEWGPNQTIVKGRVVARNTATNKVVPYASGGPNGTGAPIGLAMYDMVINADGEVFLKASADEQDPRQGPFLTAPIWKCGIFDPADLTGWDAGALAALNARVLHNGFISIPLT